MADIGSKPPPLANPLPLPPPAAPSSGSSTGKAVSAPIGLNATKGSGGAGGNGGGKGGNKNDNNGEVLVEETENNSLGFDRTGMSTANEFGIGKMTMQAALSHLRKNGEVMAPSPSELSALKKALKEHGLGAGGGARIDHFDATQAAIEHLGELDADLDLDLDLPFQDRADLDDLSLDEFDSHLFDELDPSLGIGMGPFSDRGILMPARAFGAVHIAEEFRPKSMSDKEHLDALVTDPRAGFAPEGLAAWELEHSEGIALTRAMSGRSDFTDVESGMLWSVVPLNARDENFVDLARSAKDADVGKANLIVDASAIKPTPRLVTAIRTVSATHPKIRVHLAANVQD